MNKLNLCEILKGHEGKTFYSPILGDLKLRKISDNKLVLTFDSKSNSKTDTFFIGNDGKLVHGADEIAVYPSNSLRDWNIWDKENNNKTPKTWNELKNSNKEITYNLSTIDKYACDIEIIDSPIEKSALALLRIYQLIEVSYGGNITNEEWTHENIKYVIVYHTDVKKFYVINACINKNLITFHTKEQANEFLSYPENVQLLKDYFMITY